MGPFRNRLLDERSALGWEVRRERPTVGLGPEARTTVPRQSRIPPTNCFARAAVAQWAEQLICNQQVGGSNPSSGFPFRFIFYFGLPEAMARKRGAPEDPFADVHLISGYVERRLGQLRSDPSLDMRAVFLT